MKKYVFLVLLFLITGITYTQTVVNFQKQTLDGGTQMSLRKTGLDTATANAVFVSNVIDISGYDRSKPIYYWVRTTGDDVDTLQASIEQLYTNGTTNVYDTAITLLPSNGEAGYVDTLLTQTGVTTQVTNQIRIRVNVPDLTSSISNGVFEFLIFGTMNPYYKP